MSGLLTTSPNNDFSNTHQQTIVNAASTQNDNSDLKVKELMAKLPPAPTKLGTTTETVTKKTFTETTVKRVTNNEAKIEDVVLVKAGGPMGLSIIGGSDHICVPFGTGEPGIFISKVNKYFLIVVQKCYCSTHLFSVKPFPRVNIREIDFTEKIILKIRKKCNYYYYYL